MKEAYLILDNITTSIENLRKVGLELEAYPEAEEFVGQLDYFADKLGILTNLTKMDLQGEERALSE